MTKKNFEGVSVSLDHETGEGQMLIASEARPANIKVALDFLDEHGWEELDSLETGDDPTEDAEGRTIVPLARMWGQQ